MANGTATLNHLSWPCRAAQRHCCTHGCAPPPGPHLRPDGGRQLLHRFLVMRHTPAHVLGLWGRSGGLRRGPESDMSAGSTAGPCATKGTTLMRQFYPAAPAARSPHAITPRLHIVDDLVAQLWRHIALLEGPLWCSKMDTQQAKEAWWVGRLRLRASHPVCSHADAEAPGQPLLPWPMAAHQQPIHLESVLRWVWARGKQVRPMCCPVAASSPPSPHTCHESMPSPPRASDLTAETARMYEKM